MSDDPDARYEEILRKIAERKAREQGQADLTARRDALSRALDMINAHDALEDVCTALQAKKRCYGPAVLTGRTWIGVVVWGFPREYRGYRNLTLIGVWAQHHQEGIDLIVGTRQLPYKADFYEAEAFYKLIRRGFDVYYEDDGHPPEAEGRLYSARYDLAERLTQRAAVAAALKAISIQ